MSIKYFAALVVAVTATAPIEEESAAMTECLDSATNNFDFV